MFKAILFDLDGTLIDTNRLIIESYTHTIKKHLNFTPEEKDIVKYFGEPLKITLSRYDNDKYEEMYKTYIEFNEMNHDSMVKEMDYARDALTELKKRGLPLGIVTSKRKIMAERGLKLLDLLKYFDVLITPEDTDKHKPNPEPILKACEKLNIEPRDVLFVGDSHYDILCGKNAEAKTCIVKYTMLDLEELLKFEPDYVVEDLREILRLQ
ncbi:Pyrophosphatase PpaX [Caloramator mitchellensis]|uniref:Pyrophosphatase PpaX n=1 Tax=Caloramator mitchellensis TaxID=908809 RepID=A0A0R3K260_CALMK|nr:pyrophosphatase PpaX [Caloramator mitchellensis]KRQ87614.1 Pyrophosphatase PpaX [Caloramator mitchellensis]